MPTSYTINNQEDPGRRGEQPSPSRRACRARLQRQKPLYVHGCGIHGSRYRGETARPCHVGGSKPPKAKEPTQSKTYSVGGGDIPIDQRTAAIDNRVHAIVQARGDYSEDLEPEEYMRLCARATRELEAEGVVS